jgi:hypothetical protein
MKAENAWGDEFDAWLDSVKAYAWQEGHLHDRRLGPDECVCWAWSPGECGCGKFGNGEVLSLHDNPYLGETASTQIDAYLQEQEDRAEKVHPTINTELTVAEQRRWEALGEVTGIAQERNRILAIVEEADWLGGDLAQDWANLRQRILGFPL